MKQTVNFFDYPLQFKLHEDEYRDILLDTLSRGAFLLGEDTHRFEENLAKFVGTKYAVGVGNCTDAILLSLIAAGIGPGDEVISVSHTFVATIEVMKFLGANPVFVDLAEDHNMNVDLVEAAITPKTKAIVPVHLNGTICKRMDKLVDLARKHNLVIVEDAAQSLGATFKGKGAGSFGIAGCFSFYPAKLLGAFGDAGAVVTNDEKIANHVRMLRNHGRGQGTDINIWGLNCRMDNIHAAILDFKLKKLPDWIKRRREIAGTYHDGLSSIKELRLPSPPSANSEHYDVFQNYEIEAERRDDLLLHLKTNGVHYNLSWGGKAVHQFPGLKIDKFDLPRTNELFKKVLMLPLYPELSDDQVSYVISSVRNYYAR
jgi:dTDP-4-amino-4,6-dideoxygalactose transaminase